jgi:hypothetical protein
MKSKNLRLWLIITVFLIASFTSGAIVFSGKIGLLFYGLLVFILSDLNFLPAF